jgi:hypothetical protein
MWPTKLRRPGRATMPDRQAQGRRPVPHRPVPLVPALAKALTVSTPVAAQTRLVLERAAPARRAVGK